MNPTARQHLEASERHMAAARIARDCEQWTTAEVAEALARSESRRAKRAGRE